jgi:membrane-bound serine protease (ClpP class)
MWILFAIGLFILCAILLVAEVFVPSFGLLGILAFTSLVGGIYMFFEHSALAGWIGVAAAIVLVPGVLIAAYKVMPHTRFGKKLILQTPRSEPGAGVPDVEIIRGLVGKEGLAVSMLRPVGVVRFGDLKVECMAESGYVDKNSTVRVIKVDGTQVTVRKA